jgi:hypothetical protein
VFDVYFENLVKKPNKRRKNAVCDMYPDLSESENRAVKSWKIG